MMQKDNVQKDFRFKQQQLRGHRLNQIFCLRKVWNEKLEEACEKKNDEFRGLRTEKRFQGSAKATTIGVLPL